MVRTQFVGYWPRWAAAAQFVGALPPEKRTRKCHMNAQNCIFRAKIHSAIVAASEVLPGFVELHWVFEPEQWM